MKSRAIRVFAAALSAAMLLTSSNFTALASDIGKNSNVTAEEGDVSAETGGTSKLEEPRSINEVDNHADPLDLHSSHDIDEMSHSEEEQKEAKEHILAELKENAKEGSINAEAFEEFMEGFLYPSDMFAIMSMFEEEDWAFIKDTLNEDQKAAWLKIMPHYLLSYVNSLYGTDEESGKAKVEKAIDSYLRVYTEKLQNVDNEKVEKLAFTYLDKVFSISELDVKTVDEYEDFLTKENDDLKNKLQILRNLELDDNNKITESAYDTVMTMALSIIGIQYEDNDSKNISITETETTIKPELTTEDSSKNTEIPEQNSDSTKESYDEVDSVADNTDITENGTEYKYITSFDEIDMSVNAPYETIQIKETEFDTLVTKFPEALTAVDENGTKEVIEATWTCEENPLDSNDDTFRYELEIPYNYRFTSAVESDFSSGKLFKPYIEVTIQKATIFSRMISFFTASALSTNDRVHLDAAFEEDATGWYVYLNAANMQSGDTIKMPTWSTNTAWQDDLKWYTATKGSWVVDGRSFNYRAHINLKDHKDIGSYRTDFYYCPNGGSDTPLLRENGIGCNLCYNLQGPKVTAKDVLKFSDTRFIVFLNVECPQTIDYIEFPTWTTNGGQDDIEWPKGTKGDYEFNGKHYNYRCVIKISNHKNETGQYNVHFYPTVCGIRTAIGGSEFNYDPETVVFTKSSFKITLFEDGTLAFAEDSGTGAPSSTASNLIPEKLRGKIKHVRGYELGKSGFTFSDAYGLFKGCENLETVESDFSKMASFKNVTDYTSMFEGCSTLQSLPEDFSLNKGTTNVDSMFANSGLTAYPSGISFDDDSYTGTITSMNYMFRKTKIKTVPGNFKLPNAVITARGVFSDSLLETLPNNFTFDNCKSIKDISGFISKTNIKELPWNLTIPETVTDMSQFAYGTNLKSLPDGFTVKSNNCNTNSAFYLSSISVIPATFKLPKSGDHAKMFYTSSPIKTTILTTDTNTINYNWASDNRTATNPKTKKEWKIGYPNAGDVVARLDEQGNFSIVGKGNTVTYGSQTKIPWRSNYKDIKTITFGSDVRPKDISYWFYNCTGLKQLDLAIPESVVKGESAFSGCSNLKVIGSHFDLPNYGSDAVAKGAFNNLFAVKEKTTLQIYSNNQDFAAAYAKVAKTENRVVSGTVTLNWQNGSSTDKYSYILGQGLVLPYDTASTENVDVYYKGGQDNVGWMNGKWQNGSTLGSTDHYLEMITVSSPIDDREMEIVGRVFNNKSGWSEWNNEGRLLGVEKSSNRLNAIQLDLNGTYADQYKIYYRIYTDTQGWGQWKSNGQIAGVETNTTGGNYIKMLQIKLEKTTNSINPGYEFTGWYKEKDCINKVDSISAEETDDLTLYAGWKGKTYNIVYNLNRGENDPSNPKTFEVGSGFSAKDLKEPHREGWKFGGWYTDAYFQNIFKEIPKDQAADFNLYAEWIDPTDYKITYALNGGTNDKRNPSLYHESEPVTLLNPAKNGYVFQGWYLDKELTKKVAQVGTIGMTGDVTLYASWKVVSSAIMTNYTLVNDSDGVNTFYIKVEGISSSNTMSAPTWATSDGQDDIIWGGMTKGTYEINGITYNFKYTVKKSDHHNDYGPYNTHFYTNNSVCVGTCNGYMLGAGTGYKVGDRGDSCASWTCSSPIYSYQGSHGTTVHGKFGTYQSWCAACNRAWLDLYCIEYYASCSHMGDHLTGMRQYGWCTYNGGYANGFSNGQQSGTYSHNVPICTDHRQGITYKIRFHGTTGNGSMPAQDMTYGTSAALNPNQFTNPGHVLAGWSVDRNGTSIDYQDGEIIYNLTSKDGDIIDLYAVWKSNATVVYDANGGDIGNTNTVDTVDYEKGDYTVKSNKELGFTSPDKNEFAGWSLERTGDVIFKSGELPKDITMDELNSLVDKQKQLESENETVISASGINDGSYLFLIGSNALTVGSNNNVSNAAKTGLKTQRFKVENVKDDYVMIYYGTKDKSLSVGSSLLLSEWNGSDEQLWTYKNGVLTSKSGYKLKCSPKKITYGLKDGYYTFLGLGNKVIDVGSSKELQIYSNNGGYPQQMQIKNLNNGYCSIYNFSYSNGRQGYWTIDNNSSASGARIHTQPNYNGQNGQMWQFVTIEGTGMFIESKLGTVLDVYNGDSSDGNDLQMHGGNGSAAQLWTPQRLNPLTNGVYEFSMNANKNSVIGVQNGSYASSSHLVIADNAVPEDGKYFRVTYIGSGYYRIDNIRNGMSWNIDHGYSADGTNLNTYTWQGNADNELFKFIKNSDGSYDIFAGKIGTYVGTSGTTAKGTAIKMYKSKSAYTKWNVAPAGNTADAYKTLTLYAIWGGDEPPTLEAKDTWVYYSDISSTGVPKETLLASAKAEDDKDGIITDRIEIKDYDTLKVKSKLPYDKNDPATKDYVKTLDVTYTVTDNSGNTTELTKKLYIIYPVYTEKNGNVRYVDEENINSVVGEWASENNPETLKQVFQKLKNNTPLDEYTSEFTLKETE